MKVENDILLCNIIYSYYPHKWSSIWKSWNRSQLPSSERQAALWTSHHLLVVLTYSPKQLLALKVNAKECNERFFVLFFALQLNSKCSSVQRYKMLFVFALLVCKECPRTSFPTAAAFSCVWPNLLFSGNWWISHRGKHGSNRKDTY